jgi:Short C-terminal domain
MMRRRMVGRQVARVAVGTAVVAGTAGAVHHHQAQKYAQQDAAAQQQYEQAYQQGAADAQAQQQVYAPPPQEYAPPPPQPAAAPAGSDLTAQLQQLAQLHNAGVLSDEEFAAAKAKLLGG